MKIRPLFFPCACVSALTLAVPVKPASAATLQDVVADQSAWLTAHAESKALIAAGSFERGTKVLLDTIRRPKGSVEWDVDAASALVRLAFSFHAEGRSELSTALGEAALDRLEHAEAKLKLPADVKLMTTVQAMAGLINENLAGTTEAAKGRYRKAAQLSPGSALLAAKVKKFAEQEEEAAKRLKKGE